MSILVGDAPSHVEIADLDGDGDADLNADGVVNGADLATLLTNWG